MQMVRLYFKTISKKQNQVWSDNVMIERKSMRKHHVSGKNDLKSVPVKYFCLQNHQNFIVVRQIFKFLFLTSR